MSRVYELAKELNKSNKEILDFLKSKNIELKSHMSNVDESQADMVRANYRKGNVSSAGGNAAKQEDGEKPKKKIIQVFRPQNASHMPEHRQKPQRQANDSQEQKNNEKRQNNRQGENRGTQESMRQENRNNRPNNNRYNNNNGNGEGRPNNNRYNSNNNGENRSNNRNNGDNRSNNRYNGNNNGERSNNRYNGNNNGERSNGRYNGNNNGERSNGRYNGNKMERVPMDVLAEITMESVPTIVSEEETKAEESRAASLMHRSWSL